MDIFVRGSTLYFSAPCKGPDGNPVTPDSANLYLAYSPVSGSGRSKTTVAMAITDNVVSAEWDSSVAAPAAVRWSVKAQAGSEKIVMDGELTLTANEANTAA